MTRRILSITTLVLAMLCIFNTDASAQRRKKKKEARLSIYDVDTLTNPIPRNRIYIHDKIDKAQKGVDVSDGAVDNKVDFSDDTAVNNALTKSLIRDINQMQIMVENLPAMGNDPVTVNQEKIRCLTAIWELLRMYNADVRVEPFFYRRMVNNLRELIIARHENRAMAYVQSNISMQTLNNVKNLFEPNSQERTFIYTEMGKREPEKMIKRLHEYANDPFADEIIGAAAKVVPGEVYNYASSTNYVLSGAVRRSKDPLVQTIVRIQQQSSAPLKAMPFLHDIHTNKLTVAQIDKITADPDLFYQNLVRLKIENVSLGGDTYTDELKYRGAKYVRQMNELHDSPDPVRFKCINGFSPESIYFIMVYGQDEIYTSTFLGCYKRMMERMAPRTGDQFLDTLHRDRFRTFIRMCAGYNTLSGFLQSMDEAHRTALMTDFIAGLEKGKEDDLEDAVDVADAFGSVNDPVLSSFLQNKVKENYERAYQIKSKKGIIVYGLLSTLFEGLSASENDESIKQQSELLDLPPINIVQYPNLTNDSGIVYQQIFFYGDDDGKSSYNSFLGNFKDGKWKVVTNKYWSTITSTSGKKVVIYANLPLTEPQDEEAQEALGKYLADNNIFPTIVVHRGHSYHLPFTLERLQKQNRIVVLGSCGGYHNLATVLNNAPDAHIISSKQVGTMSVNEPIIKQINDKLLAGNNINWVEMWKNLNGYFTGKRGAVKEMFDDYVPPHKNLGAIFIKAYRKQFNSDEDEE
jgi:hypothetical protein